MVDLGRSGLPNEIGPVIAFLASRRNSYMTGANVKMPTSRVVQLSSLRARAARQAHP